MAINSPNRIFFAMLNNDIPTETRYCTKVAKLSIPNNCGRLIPCESCPVEEVLDSLGKAEEKLPLESSSIQGKCLSTHSIF